MDLKTVISALLPIEKREQILGDLEERGFRPLDVANVLPLVWWSYWVRQWNTPSFVSEGASDAALHRRATQFMRRRDFSHAFSFFLQFTIAANWVRVTYLKRPATQEPWGLCLMVLISTLLYWIFGRYAPPASNRAFWLARHRTQLTSALKKAQSPLAFPYRFVSGMIKVVILEILLLPEPIDPIQRGVFITILLLSLPAIFQWERRRKRRFQLELDQLPAN